MLPKIPPQMAYWLIPESGYLCVAQKIVDTLAEQFGGPKFVPHLTAYYGLHDSRDSGENLAENTTKNIGSFSLEVEGLIFGETFTQCCYLKFKTNKIFQQIAEQIKSSVSTPVNYNAVPHLSLFYGKVSEQLKIAVKDLKFPSEIYFSEIAVVANPLQVECNNDVEQWRIDFRKMLSHFTK